MLNQCAVDIPTFASQPVSFTPHPIHGGDVETVAFVIAVPQRWAAKHWDTHGISGNVFCKSRCVIFSTSSAVVESMEFSKNQKQFTIFSRNSLSTIM